MNWYLNVFVMAVFSSVIGFSGSKAIASSSNVTMSEVFDQVSCSSTKTTERIVINGINTGVKNSLDVHGCSVKDYFEYCNNGGVLNIDFHYRGENSCEQKMAYWLFRKGQISHIEWRWIREKL